MKIRSLITRVSIDEQKLNLTRKKKGEVDFTSSDLATDYVEDILKDYLLENGRPLTDLDDVKLDVLEKATESKMHLDETPKMGGTVAGNAVEGAVFDSFIPKNLEDHLDKDELLSLTGLTKVSNALRAQYRTLFPLKEGGTGRIINPSLYITPGSALFSPPPWAEQVDTAATNGEGEIVFNKTFANKLAYFAKKKAKYGKYAFKNKMFKSYGGEVPDTWGYLAFLVMHEYRHIIAGDTTSYPEELTEYITKNIKKYTNIVTAMNGSTSKNAIIMTANKIQNYVGDYITNYLLVKSGFPQLPMGLFSDDINYDRMNSMKDMWMAVLDEMNDTIDPAKIAQMNDAMSDDHHSASGGQPQQRIRPADQCR